MSNSINELDKCVINAKIKQIIKNELNKPLSLPLIGFQCYEVLSALRRAQRRQKAALFHFYEDDGTLEVNGQS